MNKKITVHTIVKNEDQWIWYTLKSVINYVDKILIYDTGSDDNTVEIIKSIKTSKIELSLKGKQSAGGITKLRQDQIRKTKTSWFLILDGDEIYSKKGIEEIVSLINKTTEKTYGVVIPAWNLIGDVYHYHPESVDYKWPFAPKKDMGWLNLRVINKKTPGLKVEGDYPLEAYVDEKNRPLQNYGDKKLLFANTRYFHTTYLKRSSIEEERHSLKRGYKKLPELGIKMPKNIKYPEVFYQVHPQIVPDCWVKRSFSKTAVASLLTPVKIIKRKLISS